MVVVILTYFLLLLGISRLTASRSSSNDVFFRGERQSNWMLVAFGMIGASISGVTFVSVPGMVMHSNMTYLQTCMGFILGYFVVAFVLLPIYYKRNLTSIYTILQDISPEAYKTGALFFIISKVVGTAAKFFVPCYIISDATGISFPVTTICLLALIWLYTRQGGIKTLVWTDTLQTVCMLIALLLIMYEVVGALSGSSYGEESVSAIWSGVVNSPYSQIFEFSDWKSPQNFFKCFFAGIFIVIVMTGLDQGMMQKNLTCKTLRSAQKDMCTYGFAFVPVNALFLILGIMLTMLFAKQGLPLPEKPDQLLPMFVESCSGREFSILNSQFSIPPVLIFFTIGIISSSFTTVDSTLTALTTSVCVDILGNDREETLRKRIHLLMAVLMVACTMLFGLVSTNSLLDTVYKLVSYTYGPLLGLFSCALLKCRVQRHYIHPLITCVAVTLICYLLDTLVPEFTGYHFGYELLLINGLLTFVGLLITKK